MSKRVLWEGSFFANHSLAIVNRELVSRLSANREVEVAIRSDEPTTDFSWDADKVAALRALEKDATLPADVTIRHRWPPRFERPATGKWVLIQPWEFGAIPKEWQAPMRDDIDEIWVHSTYNKDCYVACGVPAEKIQVIPHGVHRAMLEPGSPFPLKTQKRFKFLFVGGTILRKGIDILLDSYVREFKRSDDVCLVIKDFGVGSFYRNQTYDRFIRELQADPSLPEIEYLTDELTPERLRDLYTSCDCLAHPYRGEGFGMPIAEAMACGLPVIVPNQGGASDFCTEETAILVEAEKRAIPPQLASGLDTVSQPWWVEVKPAALRARMREMYEDPDRALAIAQRGQLHVRTVNRWDAAAALVAERIAALTTDFNTGTVVEAVVADAPPANVTESMAFGSPEYNRARWETILTSVDSGAAYGERSLRLDPRAVEYPWVFDRISREHPSGEPVLDAGSVMNHANVLEKWSRRNPGPLSIFTLKYEGYAFVSDDVRYEFGDLRDMPYRTGWFSTVMCISTLEHVGMDTRIYGGSDPRAEDPKAEVRQVFTELARVTKPGGRLLVSVPFGAPQDLGWLRVLGLDEVRDWAKGSEWEEPVLRVFRSMADGWREVAPESATDAGFKNGRIAVPEWVPAGEAVALLEMRRKVVAVVEAPRLPIAQPKPAVADRIALQLASADSLLKKGDARGALRTVNAAVRDLGNDPEKSALVNALNLETACHFVLRDKARARKAAVQSFKLDPSNPTAWRNLQFVAIEFAKLAN